VLAAQRDIATLSGCEFVTVSVAGSPEVELCVRPAAGDPVVAWLLDHHWIDEPVQRAFLGLISPGARVVDLGCHLGVFSLSAAGLGAEVLSVDAAAEHVELVARAAVRNGFAVHPVLGALADPGGSPTVSFVPRSIHGHLLGAGEVADSVEVPVVVLDDLLDELGWDRVDAMKLDIEGAELAALRGMQRFFARGWRPPIVIECNAAMLGFQGTSVVDLRQALSELGYRLYLIDHLRPGALVETGVDAVQTESCSDLLAVVDPPGGLGDGWLVEGPFSVEMTAARVAHQAAEAAAGYRRHAADLLAHGPGWLRRWPETEATLASLACDLDPAVRAETGPPTSGSMGQLHAAAEEPMRQGPPAAAIVTAHHLSVQRPVPGLARLDVSPRPALVDLSFTVIAGECIAIVSDDAASARLLLEALAGRAPHTGTLRVAGRVVSLVDVGRLLEPDLAVEENLVLLAHHIGASDHKLAVRRDRILARAALGVPPSAPLSELSGQAVARLAVATTLEIGRGRVVLADVAPLADPDFGDFVRQGIARLRGRGTVVIQAVAARHELLFEPDRAMLLREGELRAFGWPDAVFEAHERWRLGLPDRLPGPPS